MPKVLPKPDVPTQISWVARLSRQELWKTG